MFCTQIYIVAPYNEAFHIILFDIRLHPNLSNDNNNKPNSNDDK